MEALLRIEIGGQPGMVSEMDPSEAWRYFLENNECE